MEKPRCRSVGTNGNRADVCLCQLGFILHPEDVQWGDHNLDPILPEEKGHPKHKYLPCSCWRDVDNIIVTSERCLTAE